MPNIAFSLDAPNRTIGWTSLALGVGSGLLLGLWSFGGPVPVPAILGDYGDLPRRLARLGHIAFFGLGFLNLHLATELSRLHLRDDLRRLAGRLMNFANLALPPGLFLAALVEPLKYFLPLPALAAFAALLLAARGVRAGRPS